MATAVSAKSAAHAGKLKRPTPSFVQSGPNGMRPSQPTASAVASTSKPASTNQATSSSSMNSAAVNGVSGRPMPRVRKEPLKGSDPSSRLRISTRARSIDASNGDRRSAKRLPEPYVKTTAYLLKKYAKQPPSFTIHLHPTHFRFEKQDGSFPYNSEMKVIIEHIKAGTVPHDMMEELLRGGVRFYEGCLIVRVVDHKSLSNQPSSSRSSSKEKGSLFSIHNHNEHITPSPYTPYPKQTQVQPKANSTGPPDQQLQPSGLHKEKRNDNGSSSGAPKPQVFTTVLYPTPQSLQAELTILSTTPDPRAVAQRQPQAYNVSRPPASATLPSPSTPLTAVQPSLADRGPPTKRQKMMVEPHELSEFEAKLIKATAPPLYLEPVDSFEASQKLLKSLESPLHRHKPPSPTTRRRTVAELAADEALAAEEERFMLIMDERLEPASSAAAGGNKSAVDEECGAAPFEPRFSRFKTLENIRAQYEEKAKRDHDRKLQQDRAKREQQDADRERRRSEFRQIEEQAREERRKHLAAQQSPQTQAQLVANQQSRRPPSRGNAVGIAGTQAPQSAHLAAVSQGPQSSPIVRNTTPHASSPLAGHVMVPTMSQGISMGMGSSAEAARSPIVATTSMQAGHPNAMSHPMVASRSQQGQNAHETPQMAHGTPAMSHATPIMRNITPTQRMGHGSPITTTMTQTPVMGQTMMAPQMNRMVMTPQQQHAMMQQRQAILAQQQGLNPGHQFNPQQVVQMHANAVAQQNIQQAQQQQILQQQQQHHPQQQQQPRGPQQQQMHPQAFQAQLLRSQLAHMQAAHQGHQQQQTQQQHHSNIPQLSAQQQQMLAAAQQAAAQQGAQQPNGVNNPRKHPLAQHYGNLYQSHLQRLRAEMASKYSSTVGPPHTYPAELHAHFHEGLEKEARQFVSEVMKKDRENGRQRAIIAAQVAQNQAQAQAHAQAQAQAQVHAQAQAMQQQQSHNLMGNGAGRH
ncbi:predicted protein [Uncinocarpus reesii 1704]|uniref:Spt20-like SEP domain-containing protein n=1 Tax=Uncinocarpus reesii (strain UAMH 1704) TaxID=336963 RepID=C4JIR0_UNCRE|nr:uncharacterized protein UREG_02921 [Uncinocarpus reesii 1704]EEP78072.1 predicted protein [Uncinocarpus reesii 1704]